MSSRLFQNIREKQGLAYAVFSEITPYSDAGMLTVYAGTAKETVDKVLDLTIAEFRAMKESPVSDEELLRAKNHLKGSLMLSLESTSSRMSNLARQELYFQRFYSLDEILAVHRSRHARRSAVPRPRLLPARPRRRHRPRPPQRLLRRPRPPRLLSASPCPERSIHFDGAAAFLVFLPGTAIARVIPSDFAPPRCRPDNASSLSVRRLCARGAARNIGTSP